MYEGTGTQVGNKLTFLCYEVKPHNTRQWAYIIFTLAIVLTDRCARACLCIQTEEYIDTRYLTSNKQHKKLLLHFGLYNFTIRFNFK